MSNYFWLLDNGHGGIINGKYQTAGKRSPVFNGEQIFEGDVNRRIVIGIVKALAKENITVRMIVPEAADVSLSGRAYRVNNLCAQHNDCILLSIHCNAGGGTGWECFTTKGQTKSDKVAEVLCCHAEAKFPDMRMRFDNSDGDKDKESNFYILRKTLCPAVLTENFFMDTYDPDFKLLNSPEGIARIVDLHVSAILEIEKTRPI